MRTSYLVCLMVAAYASALPTMSPYARRAMLTQHTARANAPSPAVFSPASALKRDLLARFLHTLGLHDSIAKEHRTVIEPLPRFAKRDSAAPVVNAKRLTGIGRTLVAKPDGVPVYDETELPARPQRRAMGEYTTAEASQPVADLAHGQVKVASQSASGCVALFLAFERVLTFLLALLRPLPPLRARALVRSTPSPPSP
jgi:hypothetical protein